MVLALYPQTTCFYQAQVITPPSANRSNPGYYALRFEDDNNQIREVEKKMILPIPTKAVKLKK
jgi:SAGA-associated factor 29